MDSDDLSPRPVSPLHERPPSHDPPPSRSDESQAFLEPAPNNAAKLSTSKEPCGDASDDASGMTAKKELTTHVPSIQLQRQKSALLLSALYAALAIFAWAVTCVLSFKPIGAKSYGVNTFNADNNGYGWISPIAYHNLYVKSENYFKAARIINSIVTVLTVPVATTVCAKAAVVFVQQSRGYFTLRQATALADNGWAEPHTWLRILFPNGWKRYGSRLLWLAIALHVLGFVLAPLQQLFLTTKTIKTPVWPILISDITDIPDLFDPYLDNIMEDDLVTYLRYALTATNGNDIQPNLWLRNGQNCSSVSSNGTVVADPLDLSCVTTGGTTYTGSLKAENDPFIAQLPAQFNTGLIRQFMPRLNSSLTYDAVDASEFPQGCDQLPGAFYANYSGKTGGQEYYNYSLQVCMPGNMTNSPWRATRDRQDITELMYLNASIYNYEMMDNSTVFRVQANSTAGYFELPNYLNGEHAGPLLEKDPNSLCDRHCLPQGEVIYDHDKDNLTKRAESNANVTSFYSNSSVALDSIRNRGPLLMVAMALFGETSYIATRTAHPEAYELTQEQRNEEVAIQDEMGNVPASYYICYDMFPLVALATSVSGTEANLRTPVCQTLENPGGIDSQIARWISFLWTANQQVDTMEDESDAPKYQMQPTLTAALYLANEIWLKKGTQGPTSNLWLNYDPGADTQVPAISMGGIITVSTLLGLFIAGLFAMAIYASRIPTWTSTLDSFTMMRMGAAIADQMPLRIGFNADKVQVLDDMPGWIGDEEPDANVGRLGLGAQTRLRKGKRYECFDGDKALADERRKSYGSPSYRPVPTSAAVT